jgi:hypothetical protein
MDWDTQVFYTLDEAVEWLGEQIARLVNAQRESAV